MGRLPRLTLTLVRVQRVFEFFEFFSTHSVFDSRRQFFELFEVSGSFNREV